MLAFLALVFSCSLSAVHTAGKGPTPQPCVFPFVFGGISYTSCTKDGAIDSRQWCATTSNYDKDRAWRPCFVQEYGGNSGGKPCVFPFTYKNRTFYTCTDEERGRFWCATVQNYDENPQWSFCADTKLDAEPKGPCVFPFIYNYTIYSSCTTDGISNKRPWCSLTKNYDVDLKWTYCESSEPEPREVVEIVESASCVFPFIYKGKSYFRCTTDGRTDGKLWCATTSNNDDDDDGDDDDMKIAFCQDSESKKIPPPTLVVQQTIAPTTTLSSPKPVPSVESPSCVFPFIYMGKLYRTCTKEGMSNGRLWCATSSNYDMDKKWMYCNITGQEPEQKVHCVLPFMYNRKLYLSCTTDGMAGKRPWCSLTVNYNANFQWAYCEPPGPDDIVESSPCIFPFIYKGKFYKDCTADGQSDGKLWCATTSNYDADQKSKFCEEEGSPRTPAPIPVEPQTTAPTFITSPELKVESSSCIFPFIYNSKLYTTCTSDGMTEGMFWCATSSNYDEDEEWMLCNVTGPDPNGESPSCAFPFIYKGKSYTTCTTEGMNDGTWWCATTSNYDMDKKWMYCNITGPDESLESPPCVFPFTYKGRFYYSCTPDGQSDGNFWCSTTSSYDADKKWKYCEVSGPDPNSESPVCVFPFIYKGKSYSTCTTEGMSDGTCWCATTSNYDEDKQWMYCNITGPDEHLESVPCVFPFLYKGKVYNSCTTDGQSDEKFWCATTSNYDTGKKWKFCEEPGPDQNVKGPSCTFPFIYSGKSYSTCTSEDMRDGKLWCATSSNYDVDKKWMYCNDTGPDSSKEIPRCVFPFIFNRKNYSSCTDDGRSDGKFWCATTSNYDADGKWIFCTVTNTGCVFPFIYKGDAYHSCTPLDQLEGKAWCSTTPNYQTGLKWRLCNETDCVFPFIFLGKTYHSCTTEGRFDNKRWCSLTGNYDIDRSWLHCSSGERKFQKISRT